VPTSQDFELPDQKLQINNLKIITEKHSDNEYYNIHKIINMCPNINKLNLFEEDEDGGGDIINNKYLVELGKRLNKCNNLTDLRIFQLFQLDVAEEELNFIPVLSECPNLTKLDLSQGFIKYNEAIEIARIVSVKTITHLDLSSNSISSGIEIAKILSKSISLTHLDLSSNELDYQDQEKIREILSHNQTLKLLL
jgi:Ran GTPase-activating protein (RanGAP) involved in mRNA processing and transport